MKLKRCAYYINITFRGKIIMFILESDSDILLTQMKANRLYSSFTVVTEFMIGINIYIHIYNDIMIGIRSFKRSFRYRQ